MDTRQWIEASLVVLAALGLSTACLKYRKGQADYLCGDCRFNDSALCQKEGRPQVTVCTSYRQGTVTRETAVTHQQEGKN
jgi:hypothetical protein